MNGRKLFGLTDDQLVQIGDALEVFANSAAYGVVMELLSHEVNDAAVRALNDDDDKKGKKYWRGYVAGVRYLLEEIPSAIERSRALRDTEEALDNEVVGDRLGSGSLAGA